ncbi:MAG: hypothetical protein IPP25_18145 [Saprospiraceae bacterium]|nr:hypothetical protein [Candidatus Opimibacter skivensis]
MKLQAGCVRAFRINTQRQAGAGINGFTIDRDDLVSGIYYIPDTGWRGVAYRLDEYHDDNYQMTQSV